MNHPVGRILNASPGDGIEALQAQNDLLREYVLHLASRTAEHVRAFTTRSTSKGQRRRQEATLRECERMLRAMSAPSRKIGVRTEAATPENIETTLREIARAQEENWSAGAWSRR